MNIISEPDYEEIQVTDVDIIFVGGIRESFTLFPADVRAKGAADSIVVTFSSGERLVYFCDRIIAERTRPRTIRRPKTTSTAPPAAPPTLPTPPPSPPSE